MNELKEKEAQAIKVLRTFEPEEGYVLAYSGGKDSDCIKILAQLAGVKFEAVHNLTTADAPETMQYIKSQPDVRINWARDKDGNHVTMWNLIEAIGLPTRIHRFCCAQLQKVPPFTEVRRHNNLGFRAVRQHGTGLLRLYTVRQQFFICFLGTFA